MIKVIVMLIVVFVPLIALTTILLRFVGQVYWKTQIMSLKEKKQSKRIFWKYLLFGQPPREYLVLTGRITPEEAVEMNEKEKRERIIEQRVSNTLPISEEQMEVILRKTRNDSNGSEKGE